MLSEMVEGDVLRNGSVTFTNATDPRCLKKTYNYSVCSRCDYTESTLIKQQYISC